MHTYYSFKERFEYRFEDRDKEIALLASKVQPILAEFDFIAYPQSSSNFLKKLVEYLKVQSIEILKTPFTEIVDYIKSLPLQKKEKQSHLERLEQMGVAVKINGFKASQRDKYIPILFKRVELPADKGLILDDSCFSGTTMKALKSVAPECEYLAIFAK